jgi:hypothetical protein
MVLRNHDIVRNVYQYPNDVLHEQHSLMHSCTHPKLSSAECECLTQGNRLERYEHLIRQDGGGGLRPLKRGMRIAACAQHLSPRL